LKGYHAKNPINTTGKRRIMNFRGIELPPAYYQDEWVYIIHGDCREILPSIPDKSIDLVLTDPPYGIGKDGQK